MNVVDLGRFPLLYVPPVTALRSVFLVAVGGLVAGACDGSFQVDPERDPGIVFTYPIDGQVDVPVGARVVVSFSEAVTPAAAAGISLQGPAGPVAATAEVSADGRAVAFSGPPLDEGTKYELVVRPDVLPGALNIPSSGPLLSFTTRSSRPRSASPSLVAVNGGPVADPTTFRPMFETTTVRLVFSEPLDPRSVALGAGALELVDVSSGTAVPVTLLASGIHVSLDPIPDLMPGKTYELRVGAKLLDLGGQPVGAHAIPLVPVASRGASPVRQFMRTRQDGDPGPEHTRAGGDRNTITMDKPLIGRSTTSLLPSVLASELGDPKALGGPIAFTIRRGQRLRASSLDVKLGGEIPSGLTTGEVLIELLSDAGGRIYRNPYRDPARIPDNQRSPAYVDLSLDVAVFATDPTGNAVLSQTVLGVQATGSVTATDGVLAIETVSSMELGLLGVTTAPSNMVMELITDEAATPPVDTTPPQLITSSPAMGGGDHDVDAGIDLLFDEPVDLDRVIAGGIRLQDTMGRGIDARYESRGAAIVVRPVLPLSPGSSYKVVFGDVRDASGNALAARQPLSFSTLRALPTSVPAMVTAVHPGVACTLANGRCTGGLDTDDRYRAFTLPANQRIEVSFSQSIRGQSIALGTSCGNGTIRIEQVSQTGTCTGVVPGTVIRRDRSLSFVPDAPWTDGSQYRLTLVSGNDESCAAGELCAVTGVAPSFDPLAGTEEGDAGGPSLVIDFKGAPATTGTLLMPGTIPATDLNGSGFVEDGETPRNDNRAALRITGTGGAVSEAEFNGSDCVPTSPERESCMYLSGAMPAVMGELSSSCPLPAGFSASRCVPVLLTPQPMFGTSLSLKARLGFNIDSETGTNFIRVREGATPNMGYIIDDNGTPTMIAALELYLDAPDMSLPLSDHDLHSKKMSVVLRGPMQFRPDGRVAIKLSNTADLPLVINIDAPVVNGSVSLKVPANEMKLQLVSPSPRGGL